ncbi:nucleotide-diphospho-sugar transferase [Globomyces pollinis-pini]|nr:nucleotide-diphospho-sugar transferase [Globomyces pollinis-pini]
MNMKNLGVRSQRRVVVIFIAIIFSIGLYVYSRPTVIEISPSMKLNDIEMKRVVHSNPYTCSGVSPFKIFPPPGIRPFKSKAIVSLLSSEDDGQYGVDFYFLNTLLMAYKLLINERIQLSNQVELAVLITGKLSKLKRDALLALGVRLIQFEPLTFKDVVGQVHRWKHCFAKFYMFQMSWFQQMIFFDTDVILLKSPEPMFDIMDEFKSNRTNDYFIGAAKQHWNKNGDALNGGMLMLEPSCYHFQKLVDLAPKKDLYDSKTMEQGLLNYYFKKGGAGPSGIEWQTLPATYNTQQVYERKDIDFENVVALHEKFWAVGMDNDIYSVWRKEILELKEFQINTFGDTNVGNVPEFQKDFFDVVGLKPPYQFSWMFFSNYQLCFSMVRSQQI